MKTSNKILLITILAFFLSITSLMIYAKGNMVLREESQIEGNGNWAELVLLEDFEASELYLDGNNSFVLDPNSKGVRIEGDENIIHYYRVSEAEGKLRFYHEGPRNSVMNQKLKITIGLLSKPLPKLDCNGNAKISSLDTLIGETLVLKLNGNSSSTLQLSTQVLNVNSNGNARLEILGDAKVINLNANGNSKTYATKTQTDAVNISMGGNSKMEIATTKIVMGSVNGNARFRYDEVLEQEMVSEGGNGRIRKN